MHDPMVVAFEVSLPLPKRSKWRERYEAPRWTFGRRRRTNDENLGEPVYPWWRPAGWEPRVAGRCYGLRTLATVWHVEPKGHDSGTVCKHYHRWQDDAGKWHAKPLRAWRWHVWHWHIQIHFAQALKRWLFERCIECGRGYPWGYSPISHQWHGPKSKWFRVQRHCYHHECSSLLHSRQTITTDERLIRALFAAYRTAADFGEADALARITDPKGRSMEFMDAYRLTHLIGYKRDDDYNLVPVPARGSTEGPQPPKEVKP